MADGVNARFDFTAPLPAPDEVRHAHFIAIGGSGMSGIAALFLAGGASVSGSDRADAPVLQRLRDAGARVVIGQRAETVAGLPPDAIVVVSSAIAEDNPELRAARARGLRVLHRSQALAVLSRERHGVAVAGANGKTTTSAMAVVALRAAGAGPSFAIGADIAGIGANSGGGDGPDFVVEADESDGSFVVYRPQVAVVTNVREDHLDFYGTGERLHAAYDDFAETVADDGLLVVCADDEGAAALGRRHADRLRVRGYGTSIEADLRVTDVRRDDAGSTAQVVFPGGERAGLRLRVPGVHNVLNAAGVALALTAGCGLSPAQAVDGLSRFRGTARRFELRGVAGGVRVVDDYAHNPDKVAAVIRTGLDERSDGRLVVVFQPHLYSRTRHFAPAFAEALREADVVLVTDVYAAREAPVSGVSGATIADLVPGAHYTPALDEALTLLRMTVRPGDLVLTVGAGDITTLGPRVLQALNEGSPST